MQRKIANDQLVDVARADVTAVAAFRVFGLLIPQVHMLVAAYEEQRLVGIYYAEANTWQQAITAAVLGGKNVGSAQASLNDMINQIHVLQNDSGYALSVLPGLTAAGYPGNRSTLASIRNTLNQAGLAGNQAANDVLAIKADLGA